MADFRVKDDFLDHPKTKKLARQLGDGAVLCLLRLWGHATRNKWTGELTNMDLDDVEIAANWGGVRGAFVQALLSIGFLDQGEEFFVLHDWEEHNGYVAKTGERKEQAKNAAAKRWKNRRGDAQLKNEQCSEHESALPEDANSNAPLPLPLPLPDPNPPLTPPEGEVARFLKSFPESRRQGTGAVEKKYRRLRASGRLPPIDELVGILAKQARSPAWTKNGGEYVPSPLTWLQQERWRDQLGDSPPPKAGHVPPEVEKKPPLTLEEIAERNKTLAEVREKLKHLSKGKRL